MVVSSTSLLTNFAEIRNPHKRVTDTIVLYLASRYGVAVCSPTAATKLRKILKLALFMTRNGLAPKRKLILDINLMMQRGKLLGKSLGNLMFHHHQQQQPPSSSAATPDGHAYGPDEYEFSCSNTPIPTFVPVNSQCAYNLRDLASGERQTPVPSPFSARVSNYSLAEDGDMLSCEVDSKAEEFIKKFYRQLHSQGRIPQPFTDRCVNY